MTGLRKTKGKPDPVDIHVGLRLRIRRSLLGLSQEKLAESIGLTFQQIQKYERGMNRISAGRLYQFAQILDVPVTWFYQEYMQGKVLAQVDDATFSPDSLQMVALYNALPEQKRKAFKKLLRSFVIVDDADELKAAA